MKITPLLTLLALTFQLACSLNLHAATADPNPAGHWEGVIVVSPTIKSDFEVDFAPKADHSWHGTITIPGLNVDEFDLSQVKVDGSAITFAMTDKPGGVQFAGKLADDSKAMSGDFSQGAQKFPFKLERGVTKDPQAIARMLVGAAGVGDIEILKKMLDQGADINSRTPEGMTPLFMARLRGQKETYDFLLSKGADAHAPHPTPEAMVDSLFTRLFSKDGAGAAVLVAQNGKILFEKGYGLADIIQKVPLTTTTKFCLGPATSQFTAASILWLQEAGKLHVTDPLAKYYPDFPRGKEVTLQQLLTHTSGIPNYTDQPKNPMTPATMIASIEKLPFDFNPGAKFRYSNSNYVILGDIVEKVSGQNYGDFLKQTFFDPLGMSATAVLYHDTPPADASAGMFFDVLGMASTDTSHDTPPVDVATGYEYTNGRFKKTWDWTDMSWVGGTSSLYSTVEDLYRWNEGVFGHKVLNNDSLAAAFAPVVTEENKAEKQDDGYGFGWMISRLRGAREISHGGGHEGFFTYLLRLPDRNFTVVVLTNSFPQKLAVNPALLAHIVVVLYLGSDLAVLPPKPPVATVPVAALAAIEGRYDYGPMVLVVTREGNRVFAQLGLQPRFEFFPKSETEFFWKVVDAEVTFVKDANGKVVRAIHHQNGRTIYAPRLEDIVEIKLPAAVLAAIVGRYDFGKQIAVITQDGDRVFTQMGDQPRFEIFPKSETEFFLKEVNAQLTFVKDANGKVVSVINHQNGKTHNAPRLEDIVEIKLDDAHSTPILGEYTRAPDKTLTISREDGRLYVQKSDGPKVELSAKSDTEFFLNQGKVRLTVVRDAKGNVTSVILHQPNGKSHEWQKVKPAAP
ncbi:MAG TPA: serine hydrolase [Opitutaceae bacterium]|jgi:CubicO group peptidase (beta-lactamase class C family)|nr:serine hydrolase [Opitutaceae bacterium]